MSSHLDMLHNSPNAVGIAWDHGNAFWKLYLNTDDCQGLYQRAIDAGSESVAAPVRLEQWPVTVAFIKDPDGYQIEILQHHAQ